MLNSVMETDLADEAVSSNNEDGGVAFRELVADIAKTEQLGARFAFVSIDLQNDFCHEKGALAGYVESLEAIQGASSRTFELFRKARTSGFPCIFVRSFFDEKYKLPSAMRFHKQMTIHAEICKEGTWGSEFYLVNPDPSDAIVTKHTNDAFLYTYLEPLLRKYNIDTVVLTGVLTEMCLEETARSAFRRGFSVVVARDCTAGRNTICEKHALNQLISMSMVVTDRL